MAFEVSMSYLEGLGFFRANSELKIFIFLLQPHRFALGHHNISSLRVIPCAFL